MEVKLKFCKFHSFGYQKAFGWKGYIKFTQSKIIFFTTQNKAYFYLHTKSCFNFIEPLNKALFLSKKLSC